MIVEAVRNEVGCSPPKSATAVKNKKWGSLEKNDHARADDQVGSRAGLLRSIVHASLSVELFATSLFFKY